MVAYSPSMVLLRRGAFYARLADGLETIAREFAAAEPVAADDAGTVQALIADLRGAINRTGTGELVIELGGSERAAADRLHRLLSAVVAGILETVKLSFDRREAAVGETLKQ